MIRESASATNLPDTRRVSFGLPTALTSLGDATVAPAHQQSLVSSPSKPSSRLELSLSEGYGIYSLTLACWPLRSFYEPMTYVIGSGDSQFGTTRTFEPLEAHFTWHLQSSAMLISAYRIMLGDSDFGALGKAWLVSTKDDVPVRRPLDTQVRLRQSGEAVAFSLGGFSVFFDESAEAVGRSLEQAKQPSTLAQDIRAAHLAASVDAEAIEAARRAVDDAASFADSGVGDSKPLIMISEDGVVTLQWRSSDQGAMVVFTGDGTATYSVKEPGGQYATGGKEFELVGGVPASLKSAIDRIAP